MSDDDVARPATIYDVAAAAGVSPATVSRTFSRPGRVSAKTAEHIRAVAADLGYRAEQIAAPVLPAKRKALGLAVADITNPFNFGIIRGAEEAAAQHGYAIVLIDTRESDQLERTLLNRTLPLLDAMLVASSRVSDTHLRQVGKQLPVVVLNRHVSGMPSIVTDNERGMRRAVEHLAELGHRQIWYVAGPEASWADGVRWRAMRESALELVLTAHRVGPNVPTMREAPAIADELLSRGAKAVICYNDLLAFGLVLALRQRGVSVPEQMSIIGFDNAFGCDLLSPGLTTVAAPLGQLGELGITNLVGLLGGAKWRSATPLRVPVKLIVRGSTAAPTGQRPARAHLTR
ncbi:LacI family DNA-binding transcriptional regulator [Propionibacteriaceae bacterium G1746]|uniref:LacI family DNA-binding transcriptional regulator n=1 Tax=Aestuariimicrobium sp. G57 TaxID=3418485 RepID=UPI003C17ED59